MKHMAVLVLILSVLGLSATGILAEEVDDRGVLQRFEWVLNVDKGKLGSILKKDDVFVFQKEGLYGIVMTDIQKAFLFDPRSGAWLIRHLKPELHVCGGFQNKDRRQIVFILERIALDTPLAPEGDSLAQPLSDYEIWKSARSVCHHVTTRPAQPPALLRR